MSDPWPSGLQPLPPSYSHDYITSASTTEIRVLKGDSFYHYPQLTALSDNTYIDHGYPNAIRTVEGDIVAELKHVSDRSIVWDQENIITSHCEGVCIFNTADESTVIYNPALTAERPKTPLGLLDEERFLSCTEKKIFLWERNNTSPIRIWKIRQTAFGERISHILVIDKDRFLVIYDFGRVLIFDIDRQDPIAVIDEKLHPLWGGKFVPVCPGLFLHVWDRYRSFRLLNVSMQGVDLQYEFSPHPGGMRDAAMLSSRVAAIVTSRSLAIWWLPHKPGETPRLLAEKIVEKNKFGSVCALPSNDANIGRLILAGHRKYRAYWEVKLFDCDP